MPDERCNIFYVAIVNTTRQLQSTVSIVDFGKDQIDSWMDDQLGCEANRQTDE